MSEQDNDRPRSSPTASTTISTLLQQSLNAANSAYYDHPNQPPHSHHAHGHQAPVEEVPPPAYDAQSYGILNVTQNGLNTGARVSNDGRVDIKIKEKSKRVTDVLAPMLRRQYTEAAAQPQPIIPDGLGYVDGLPPPPMNIVIQIVGSRGDVQPFVALGQILKNKFNHRVRLATHPVFRSFVQENGLEFFSIGGDPAELMAFMVKNPGLMPGIDSLRAGDIGKRRKASYEMILGCWRSCIEPGDGTGMVASDELLENQSVDSAISMGDPDSKPFVADAIIANPPSFAHVHIAEKLGIPLHLMFTMPWSPTQAFPHPLANIISSNTDQNLANFISYVLVDMLTWQGLGDIINKFRERILHLEPVSIIWAPGMLGRLRIPYTYCWSPALIPKPKDWGPHIDISGFYFLDLANNFTPPADLAAFLEAGPPPVYIGFGSIVVDDPNTMTKMIFEAIEKTGQRALVSKGWGGLGADELGMPEGVFMLGNCPHDWLFQRVSCVVHHGGAGTTAAGITAGCPSVIVPFFGDQPFWGAMVARAGAGPKPIPYKDLDADKFANQILEALKPESKSKALELSNKIKQESGTQTGADTFHKQLDVQRMRCSICPGRVAVWRVRRTDIRLSPLAATVLGNEGLLDFADLKLYRPYDYAVDEGPPEPISGGASALIGTISELGAGVADMPSEILKNMKFGEYKRKEQQAATSQQNSQNGSSSSTQPGSASSGTPVRTVSPAIADEKSSQPEILVENSLDATVVQDREAGTPSASSSNVALQPPPSIASVLAPDGARRRSWSLSSRSRSSSTSSNTERKASQVRQTTHEAGQITLDSVIGASKAGGKIIGVGLKSPMDFTMSLAQGFHNAPKLYGDTTVRKPDKITDFQSGLKAAGKEFGFGFYDGISGLVTQPLRGARKEGAAGLVKGFMKGGMGLVLKPGAAIWGLPGYTFKGIYMELTKHFGSSTRNYIIAARTAQGYEDWKQSSAGERERIVATWKSNKLESKRGKEKFGRDRQAELEAHILQPTKSKNHAELVSGFRKTRHLTYEERKELDKRKQALKKEEKERKKRGDSLGASASPPPPTMNTRSSTASGADLVLGAQPLSSPPPGRNSSSPSIQNSRDEAFEEAIKRSVSQTSKGNPEEDAIIERALRASVAALKSHPEPITDDNEDEAYSRAVQASIAEAKRAQLERHPASNTDITEDDEELRRALTQSLEEHRRQQEIQGPWNDNDSGVGTEDDQDIKRSIEDSNQASINPRPQGTARPAPPALPPRENSAANPNYLSQQNDADDEEEEEEEQIRQALAASLSHNQNHDTDHMDDEEEQLRRALTLSEQENKQNEAELGRQRTEEDIVLEYVKKQSLLEEEHRKARTQEH